MPKKTKGWSARRRAQQAANIRKTAPWTSATGPRTPEGKAATAQNAKKSGLYSIHIITLKRALAAHAANIRSISGDK